MTDLGFSTIGCGTFSILAGGLICGSLCPPNAGDGLITGGLATRFWGTSCFGGATTAGAVGAAAGATSGLPQK